MIRKTILLVASLGFAGAALAIVGNVLMLRPAAAVKPGAAPARQ